MYFVLLKPPGLFLIKSYYSRIFYDKRMAAEVEVDALGEEFKGYVMKITGGNDKQGFAMVQGVMLAGRVRLLLDKSKYFCNHACSPFSQVLTLLC